MKNDTQLVVFSIKVDGKICEYGVPIVHVQEINRVTEVTRLPQLPLFVEGIINLRGQIVPLIDLKKRFDMGYTELGDETRIIVFDSLGQKLGIIVDDVQEVLHINGNEIEEQLFSGLGKSAEFIDGIAKVNERLIIILNLSKIFNQDEKNTMSDLINQEVAV